MLPVVNYYIRIFLPIGTILIIVLIFGNREEEPWFLKFFILVWVSLAINISIFFWKTRDVIMAVNTPFLQIPRLILGPNFTRDPFKAVANELPAYLKCDKCGDPAISQKRVMWEFHDICRNCGNHNLASS